MTHEAHTYPEYGNNQPNEDAVGVIDEIEQQSVPGPNVEGPTAAMFEELLERRHHEPIRNLLTETTNSMSRRGISPGAAVSGLRTTLIDYFAKRYIELFRQDFSDEALLTKEGWVVPFDILEDELAKSTSIEADFAIGVGVNLFHAATPVKERYLIDDVYTKLIRERFPEGARVLDIGSSVMAGPIFLMNKDRFSPVTFEAVTFQPPNSSQEIDLTEKTNAVVLGEDTAIKEFVCVDSFPVFYEYRSSYDTGFLPYALHGLRSSERNSCIYFSELKAGLNIKQRGTEEYRENSGVTFEQANLLDTVELAQFKDKYPEPFDVIIINYLTQELSSQEQVELHAIAESLVAENGLIIYTHQAHIPEGAPQPAVITDVVHFSSYASQPWMSYSHVQDNLFQPLRKSAGLQEMANFYDNRNRRVRLRMGKLVINGEAVPLTDAIRHV